MIAEIALAVVLLDRRGPDAAHALVAAADRSRLHAVRRADACASRCRARPTRRPEQVVNFYSRLIDQLHATPGFKAAGAARSLPLGSTIGDFGLQVDGYVPPPGTNAKGDWQIVTDGYLEAMGERIARGRGIERPDTPRLAAGRARQRRDGAALLGRPGSDRRPLPDRDAIRAVRGSPWSASSRTSVTTASPAW